MLVEDGPSGPSAAGQRRVLLYGDLDLNLLDGSAVWLVSMVEAVSMTDSEVHLLLKAPVGNDRLLDRVSRLAAVHVHQPAARQDTGEPGVVEPLTPVQARSRLEEIDVLVRADVVIARGLAVCAELARSSLASRLWSYVSDLPFPPGATSSRQRRLLRRAMSGSRRVFAQTENARAYVEAVMPVAAGKCVLLNPMVPDSFFTERSVARPVAGDAPLRLVYAGKFAKDWKTLEMCALPAQLDRAGVPAELTLLGDKFQHTVKDPDWPERMRAATEQPHVRWLGGVAREQAQREIAEAEVGLSWRSGSLEDSLELSTKVLEYAAAGVAPVLNRTEAHEELLGADYPLFLDHDGSAEVLRVLGTARSQLDLAVQRAQAAARWYSLSASAARLRLEFERVEENLRRRPPSTRRLRIALAGHDLKFAGELIELLESRPDVDLRVDRWATLHEHDEAASQELVDWADVVLCEWAGPNAVWYAAHKRHGQRLVVRLHGFELRGPWLGELDFDAVDTLVTVSPLLRRRTLEQTGWAAERVTVLPNMLDCRDLDRPKLLGAEHRIGLVGLVPFLKRPDRALSVLEHLLDVDDRFTLHLRGRMPWEYPYVWQRSGEREAYLAFFERVGRSPRLAERVAFEPFGADMASWLRKIGFVLSPSSSETFHLAPAEGMASGSIPVLWQRDGVRDIFPERFVVPDSEAAAELILRHVADPERRAREARAVRTAVADYDVGEVGQAWLRCLWETPSSVEPAGVRFVPEVAALS